MNTYSLQINNTSNLAYSQASVTDSVVSANGVNTPVSQLATERFTVVVPQYLQDKFNANCNIWVQSANLVCKDVFKTNLKNDIAIMCDVNQPNSFDQTTNSNSQFLTNLSVVTAFVAGEDMGCCNTMYEGHKIFVNTVPNNLTFWVANMPERIPLTLGSNVFVNINLMVEVLEDCNCH